MKRTFLLVAITILAAVQTQGKVVLPSIFTNNMVLQQQRELKIKGKATPESKVTLKVGWQRDIVTTQTDSEGNFIIEIHTPKAGGPYTLTFSDGEDTTLDNVLIGEIWLGSGQSNMDESMNGYSWGDSIDNHLQEIHDANYPQIRLFHVGIVNDFNRHDSFQLPVLMNGWQECAPQTVENFSATGYFFALHLWESLRIPIGIIHDACGGSRIEPWVRTEVLEGVYGCDYKIDFIKSKNNDLETLKSIFQAKKTLASQGLMEQPKWEEEPNTMNFPGGFWNAMIQPLVDFPMRGFIWYQGCSNVSKNDVGGKTRVNNADSYEACFQAMIEDWREQFGQPEMPFYFMQLANFRSRHELQPQSEWAALREAQAAALRLHNTGMAVNIDAGDSLCIHPSCKREMSRRLAAIALNQTYGMKKVPYTAPVYKSYQVKGNELHIQFDYPSGSEPFVQSENLTGFTIAGSDRIWHVAKACTHGNEVIVTCPDVKVPLAARYGWADNPECTLHTMGNFYVAPFRTDNWPTE